jgi:site-specific recombinase XerD
VLIERACVDPEAVGRLLTLTRAELITFRTHLKEVGLSTLAVNRRLAGVGTILRELQLQGHRPDNPAERLRTLRTNGDYSPTIGLTAEQAKALLAAPVGDDSPLSQATGTPIDAACGDVDADYHSLDRIRHCLTTVRRPHHTGHG